jgi:exosortase/archaeosortase family protein
VDKRVITALFKSEKYRAFREVFWFGVITLAIHYSYRFWAHDLHYQPIAAFMSDMQQFLTGVVYHQTAWVVKHILCLPVDLYGFTIYFESGSWITVNKSCAGDKQILQFALLILIYPGVWKHKLWYIPLGMVIIHFTNILRIALLAVVSAYRPEYWDVAHNVVLRGMFYVVILVLWIVWMERVNKK